MVCYFSLATTFVEQAIVWNKVEIAIYADVDRSTVERWSDNAWIVSTFLDKVRITWGVIILVQVYLARDMPFYINTLLGGSVCKKDFNAGFATQLGFITLDNIIDFFWFWIENTTYALTPLSSRIIIEREINETNSMELAMADGDPAIMWRAFKKAKGENVDVPDETEGKRRSVTKSCLKPGLNSSQRLAVAIDG